MWISPQTLDLSRKDGVDNSVEKLPFYSHNAPFFVDKKTPFR